MIVVCGEILIDLVPERAGGAYAARAGGGPANVAVGLGRLGVDVAFLGRLAQDRFGALLRDHLHASRVGLDLVVRPPAPTTLAVVNLDPAGGATYDFYVDGCADGTWHPEELPETLGAAGALHVSGSLALAVPTMGVALDLLLTREQPQRVITFDPNIRPSLVRDEAAVRARLARWLGLADLVKASEEDLAWVAPGQPVEATARQWRELGPALVVVTRGGKGVYALGPAGPVDLPTEPVTIVDTVGAGDAFMSGLLAALDQQGWLTRPALAGLTLAQVADALAFAQRVAVVTCTRVGADPPWRDELT